MADSVISALPAVGAVGPTDIFPLVQSGITSRATISQITAALSGVTSVSVATANGFGGTVATATTTPVITMRVTITGLLKGNGTAVSAATVGTDYSVGTSVLATGILKSTTATGALSIATGADLPVMTATVGGAVPTPPNNTTTYLRGDGTFAAPPGTGTVTSASVATANGFAGTVANPTTTPAITLTTSVTGLLLGNGTAVAAAVNSDLPAMSATVGGAVPTPPNNTTTFLRGDGTFAVPAGSGGGVNNLRKTSNYTAVAGDAILADTSGGAFTITLPAAPAQFDTIGPIEDTAGTFNTNNLTIGANSLKIMGISADMIVSRRYAAFSLKYDNATNGWRIV